MRSRLLSMAVVVVAALGVGASSASASKIVDINYGNFSLAQGESFSALQEEFSGESIDFATSAGTVECRNESNHNALLGEVVTNDQKEDRISFTDGGFEFGEPCKLGEGVAYAIPGGFPWQLALKSSGAMQITGSSAITVTLELPGGATCEYSRSKLVARTPTTFGKSVPFVVAIDSQKLKLETAGSTGACPKTAAMTGTLKTSGPKGPVDVLVLSS
jgi:hypothetical protein